MENIVAPVLEQTGSSLHFKGAIPVTERRGPVTMALLWITLVTAFPCVLIGFEWYKQQMSLAQVIASSLLACLITLLYAVPICSLSARTGLSFKLLGRHVFGHQGARALTISLIFIYIGWYALVSLLMADAACGLFAFKSLPVAAVFFSFLMALNNFFGFKGVANFARFVAGPMLIIWVFYTFGKVVFQLTPDSAMVAERIPFWTAFTGVSQFIIGFAIWGNEADYWRHAQAGRRNITLALAAALVLGVVIFPVTGWLLAFQSGVTEPAQATNLMNRFSFGSFSLIAITVLGTAYFAANDANLYALTHGLESFTKLSQKKTVLAVTIAASGVAFLLAQSGTAKALECVCSLNSVILPTASVIIASEWFVFKSANCHNRTISRPAVVAFMAGVTVGVLTSGTIPALNFLHVGIAPLQAWLLALAIYIPWRFFESRREATGAGAEISNERFS